MNLPRTSSRTSVRFSTMMIVMMMMIMIMIMMMPGNPYDCPENFYNASMMSSAGYSQVADYQAHMAQGEVAITLGKCRFMF